MKDQLDYAYSVASQYWPGLPRKDYEAWVDDQSLARLEWADIVGEEPSRARVERFYREGFGYLVYLTRELLPPGSWGNLEDRANIVRRYMRSTGLERVLDFGGGIGGTVLQLAHWGFTAGLLEVGPILEFARWYVERQGLLVDIPRPGHVCCYDGALPAHDYEAICALDVLEHCWEPVELLRQFHERLPAGGLLILTRHSFKEHLTHLTRTFWLFDKLDKLLAEIGFDRRAEPDPHYGIGAWRKAREP